MEGFRRLKEAYTLSHLLSWRGIGARVLTGCLLFVPILGTILFIALRSFAPLSFQPYKQPRLVDRKPILVGSPTPGELNNEDPAIDAWAVDTACKLNKRVLNETHLPLLETALEEGEKLGCLNRPILSVYRGTVLHSLAMRGASAPFFQLAFAKQIDPSIQDDELGNTALHWAIANAKNSAAMLLMEQGGGADLFNIQCKSYQNTPLHLAIGKGYKDRSADGDVLIHSNYELAAKLLGLGANPNLQNKDGNTPLHLAALRRDPDLLKLLLGHRADATIRNHQGKTPLELLGGTYEEAYLLLQETVGAFLLDRGEWERNGAHARAAF